MCQNNIVYLTSEHVFFIYNDALNNFGGEIGLYIDTSDKIESILSQQLPIFGYDKYPSVFQKAAMLLYFFVKSHCFVDGNKRVAIQSAIVFLCLNGYEDCLDDLEGYTMTIEVALSNILENERDEYINYIANWLSKRFI
ncbi:death-on-curing protein [Ruminiclostridium sufflavum DSM 19573]|uniref:Death-on-curing protein n=1 Tax=Ruminiclostridium sufflavum DSM 19573 TaxID=1121337 RepID=A0A318XFC5_9FIRM|nr:type II toxin-antitoxin system death-on-curing family toxin [Ruminiclostridium sufflavum]PYG84258.1 death-on-curing protein [Ruminiclostridium sufflavum DSM 19573]